MKKNTQTSISMVMITDLPILILDKPASLSVANLVMGFKPSRLASVVFSNPIMQSSDDRYVDVRFYPRSTTEKREITRNICRALLEKSV